MNTDSYNSLIDYVGLCNQIKKYNFHDRINRTGLGIQYTPLPEGGGYLEFVGLPEMQELESFLLYFRIFYQKNDYSLNGAKINAIYRDLTISDSWKSNYLTIKKSYNNYLNGYCDSGNVPTEQRLKRKEIVDVVLYGHFAHRNQVEKYNNWVRDDFGKNQLYQFFFFILLELLNFVYSFSDISHQELKRLIDSESI